MNQLEENIKNLQILISEKEKRKHNLHSVWERRKTEKEIKIMNKRLKGLLKQKGE